MVCTLGMSGFLDLSGERLLWGRMIFLTWVGLSTGDGQGLVLGGGR